MTSAHDEESEFYIRLGGQKSIDLLYPLAGKPRDESLRALFSAFASENGYLAYLDHDEFCVIVCRSRDFTKMRIYLYDGEAPYDGVYLGDSLSTYDELDQTRV